ncbi:lipopolysaccharide heptosyltransferase [Thiomicrospira aerophila AL3]|uniref:Lipopolysaccharide heptosyltransferase 1 n=1 Tax=Thiomicrospira aerophila AL3 TaxID=717772 RepID=W0DW42_9GAMM|nr:lipopolysaccharide heptosyltransferase I [Thiomicrospira aerophila]AHF01101.1 lipopolysaccharide heptosyltransferase [Thiomicrospira aerophila AL3]
MTKRVLLIKMSSLGDIVHTFPALTDAQKALPGIQFDWVVEAPFKDLPKLHPAVNQVIVNPRLAINKNRFSLTSLQLYQEFKQKIQSTHYDAVIENQYVNKGAKVAKLAKGIKHGLTANSAHDACIAKVFDHAHYVSRSLHAIDRSRKLLALSLGYDTAFKEHTTDLDNALDYGLDLSHIELDEHNQRWQQQTGEYLVFCQATTWATKHLPIKMWIELLEKAKQAGLPVLLPWVGDKEQAQVSAMIQQAQWGEILPAQSLEQWAKLLAGARGIIGVDTGLTHLAAALNKPTLCLFGPTNPNLTAAKGRRAKTLWLNLACSPCMQTHCPREGGQVCFSQMNVDEVWGELNARH